MYKYNVGDRVIFLDNQKDEKVGTVKEVEESFDGKRNLYLMHNYPYLRYEEEILEVENK